MAEPGDSFSLHRTGTVIYSLSENVAVGTSTISGLDLAVSESWTRSQTDTALTQSGTSTADGSLGYTLSESATGSDYTITRTGDETVTTISTETVTDGTFAATDIWSESTAAAGEYDLPFNPFNPLYQTWTGSESSNHVETGYHGPESYDLTTSETGSVTGSETPGVSFARSELFAGSYSLSKTTRTQPGPGRCLPPGGKSVRFKC